LIDALLQVCDLYQIELPGDQREVKLRYRSGEQG